MKIAFMLNKAIKADDRDYASFAHGLAILCAKAAPLGRRLWRRYTKPESSNT